MRAWRKLRHRLLTLKQEVSLNNRKNVQIASSFSLESSACLGSLHTHRPRPILTTLETFLSKTNRRSRQSQKSASLTPSRNKPPREKNKSFRINTRFESCARRHAGGGREPTMRFVVA